MFLFYIFRPKDKWKKKELVGWCSVYESEKVFQVAFLAEGLNGVKTAKKLAIRRKNWQNLTFSRNKKKLTKTILVIRMKRCLPLALN